MGLYDRDYMKHGYDQNNLKEASGSGRKKTIAAIAAVVIALIFFAAFLL